MIKTSLDYGGKYYHEEIALKNNSIIEKCIFDNDDSLYWKNWEIKNLYNYSGIQLNYSVTKFTSNNLRSNENFALVKFYNDNNLDPIVLDKKLKFILSFNVHMFINLNIKISYNENIENILNLINLYKDNLEIICFQEVVFNNKIISEKIITLIKEIYPYVYFCENGSRNNQLTVACKKKYNYQIINLKISNNEEKKYFNNLYNSEYFFKGALSKIMRNIIIINTEYGKIANIQLDYGLKNVKNTNNTINDNINKINSKLRILMLTKLLTYSPDIIIGDFNFTSDDPETKFLIKNKYYLVESTKTLSTPYNRVDYCFIKKNKINNKNNKNILLKCNYSMHLPMFQSL